MYEHYIFLIIMHILERVTFHELHVSFIVVLSCNNLHIFNAAKTNQMKDKHIVLHYVYTYIFSFMA